MLFNVDRFIGPFLSVVQKWDKDLLLISNILTAWGSVQLKWTYLEEIFLDEKFRSQLREEATQFDGLHRKFKLLMENTRKKPKIMVLSKTPELLDELNQMFEGFEACQKSLNKYLDAKRNSFPRFYFLSDNELLSVLGNANHEGIQEHIVKMFDNVGSLSFASNTRENNVIKAMVSCEKETMEFKTEVMIEGPVENWMTSALKEMWESIRFLIKKSIFDYARSTKSRCEWMLDYQGQMCLAANGVWWTAEVENVFTEFENVSLPAPFVRSIQLFFERREEIDFTTIKNFVFPIFSLGFIFLIVRLGYPIYSERFSNFRLSFEL